MMQQTYRHSGGLGRSVFLIPIGGMLGALVLSFIYGYICVYNPIVGYISFLLTGGFAFGLIMLLYFLATAGKCRNTLFLRVMGGWIGLIALYASWVVFLYALLSRYAEVDLNLSLLGMFLSPEEIWKFIVDLNGSGWFSIKSWTPSGVVLWVFWGIEAVIIALAPLFVADGAINDNVFCERCNEWCETNDKFQLRMPSDSGAIEQLKQGSLDTLTALDRVSVEEYPRLEVTLHICKHCSKMAAYKIETTQLEVDKDGKGSEKHEALTPILLLHPDGVQRLTDLAAHAVELPLTSEDFQGAIPNGDDSVMPKET